jgi:transmembrane sensor
MNRNDIRDLLNRYASGNCSDEEKTIVESWYLQYRNDTKVDLTDLDRINDLQIVYDSLPGNHNVKVYPIHLSKIAATIAALFIMIIGFYFYDSYYNSPKLTKISSPRIVPGGNKATLTLADGSKILLDDAKTGVLANQAGVSVHKSANGQLIYSVTNTTTPDSKIDETEVYNTIETPVGGSYQINLPDGTKVWLNAASSLSFPARFTSGSRSVKLTGEGYFQVAKNKEMPFMVNFNNQVVEVLGTTFNINSYSNEGTDKTTLFEGSVKLRQNDREVLLVPGQQAIYEKNEIKVVVADLEEASAWKNGYFIFKNEDIQSIMRKISRWYDVEISYSGKIPDIGFGGNISRSTDITEVLHALELTNSVHFKIDGRRIVVMP